MLPDGEVERLEALAQLCVLDTESEIEFDALARAAALVCDVPISLISLVDEKRQWFKANYGLEGFAQTQREIAFCSHAILQDDIFEIGDAAADNRFADNPLVAGEPNIRFYAGVPLKLGNGANVGTLCVIDRRPRRLNSLQRAVLGELASAAVLALEGRRALMSERELRTRFAAEAAARVESELKFRTLSEASPLGVYATDPSGACVYTNAQWQSIFGLTLEQSLGEAWATAIHPDDRDGVFSSWRRAAESGAEFDMEFRILRPDGTRNTVRSRAWASLDEAGTLSGYVGSVEDVTHARGVQEQLANERARMASIIEGTGAGTWEWNVQTGETRFNAKWASIIGYSLDELGPTSIQTWISFTHPDDLERSNQLLNTHFEGRSSHYECEGRMRHRDGHWVWILDRGRVLSWTPDGKPEWMFGTHIDISARKAQEAALERSEWLLTRTGEIAGIGGWEFDLKTNEVTWTRQTKLLHGVAPDYVPNLAAGINFYKEEARPIVSAAVQRAVEFGEGFDLELPLVRADGRSIWIRAVGTAEFENGKPVRLLGAFQDISQQRALHAELADQYELLRVTLSSIADAVITTDEHGQITWLNPMAEQITGWTNIEACGHAIEAIFQLVERETKRPIINPATDCLACGEVCAVTAQAVLLARGRDAYEADLLASPIRKENGHVLGAVLVFRDVTEQRRLQEEMTYRATHDMLTGLINRIEFENRLQTALEDALAGRGEHALLFIDLDQFKIVNDACGHHVGDQLLKQVGDLLGRFVGSEDVLARLGGDEFGIVLKDQSMIQAQDVAERICKWLDDFRFSHESRRFRVGVSIGLVPLDTRWVRSTVVLQAAESSCYAAKEAGRSQVHVWLDSDLMLNMRHGEMRWASRIEQALDEDRFALHAQKIVPLASTPAGFHAELLLRLIEADGSTVMPAAFLPAAERFHLIARVDRWVVARIIKLLSDMNDRSRVSSLSFNLSGQSIGDRTFHRYALDMLTAAGPDICQRLCIEITETSAITNLTDAVSFTEQMQSLGIRIALDDFGSGASSFNYIKSIPVNLIKIDGKFIQNIVNDPLDEVAVRCFVDAARVIGVQTVAEFVENQETADKLIGMGVDLAQGFLYHRPEPIEILLGHPCRDRGFN